MRDGTRIAVVIPALNEERAIGRVSPTIPAWVDRVIVADNGSTDRTAEIAREPARSSSPSRSPAMALPASPA